MPTAKPQTAVVTGSVPALLWKRIAAFVVDILVLDLTIFAPFKGILERAVPIRDFTSLSAMLDSGMQMSGALTFTILSMGLLAILYFALCESIIGQTVGKMLFRLRVAGIGSKPGFWRCFLSNLFLLPVFPFVIFWLLDPLYMFFTRSSQRLLERWSGTATIESNPFTFQISKV